MKLRVLTAAACAAILAGCAGPGAQTERQPQATSHPAAAPAPQALKHIILIVGDGMGINTLTAARIYAHGEAGELTLDTLPESAYVKTYSNDMQVTDAAAAMSAYMTGIKTNNGQLSAGGCLPPGARGMAPAGGGFAAPRAPATLLELARQHGWSAGVVNAASVTDALTAAGYAHSCQSTREDDIAAALVPGGAGYNAALGDGLDVVLGGGVQHFHQRADGRDLLAELRAHGYRNVADGAALAALAPGQRVAGLFGTKSSSLAQMTASAIDQLAARGDGFFLVVGNGLIGQAQRASHARRALDETVALDAALQTAITKMRALDPELRQTLIVMTATSDSTLILNGYAARTGRTTASQPGVLGLVRRYADGAYAKDLDDVPYTIIGYGNGANRLADSRAGGPVLSDAIVSEPGYRQEATLRMAPGAATNGGTDVYLGAIGAHAQDLRGTLENTAVHAALKSAAGW